MSVEAINSIFDALSNFDVISRDTDIKPEFFNRAVLRIDNESYCISVFKPAKEYQRAEENDSGTRSAKSIDSERDAEVPHHPV